MLETDLSIFCFSIVYNQSCIHRQGSLGYQQWLSALTRGVWRFSGVDVAVWVKIWWIDVALARIAATEQNGCSQVSVISLCTQMTLSEVAETKESMNAVLRCCNQSAVGLHLVCAIATPVIWIWCAVLWVICILTNLVSHFTIQWIFTVQRIWWRQKVGCSLIHT